MRCFTKLTPAEISCPRWPQPQKGQWEERLFVAMQSPVSQLKQPISVGPPHVGVVYTALCPGQPFATTEPFPLLHAWLLHSPTERYQIAKHVNGPHTI